MEHVKFNDYQVSAGVPVSTGVKVAFRLGLLGLVLVASLLPLSSCSSGRSSQPATYETPEEDYIYHRIKYSGETVAIISAWYTKSSKNWPEIVDSNPNMVPSRLRIGDLVRIPKRLVRRFSSLPQEFVGSFKSGVNKDSSSATENSQSGFNTGEPAPSTRPESVVSEEAPSSASDFTVEEPMQATSDDSQSAPEPIQESYEVEAAPAVSEPVVEAPAVAVPPPPANDENQKVREQLMQELLQ